MQTVNMHDAKTHLSRLVEKASKGEPFIIARAGKPLVKVVALDTPEPVVKSRLGFLKGMMIVPESRRDFKSIADEEIEAMSEFLRNPSQIDELFISKSAFHAFMDFVGNLPVQER